MVGSAEAINFPRLNSSPTSMMRTFTPEPRGGMRGGRRELPREPWRQHPPQQPQPQTENFSRMTRMERDPLSFEQAVALGSSDEFL
jgi:hypothetical protein